MKFKNQFPVDCIIENQINSHGKAVLELTLYYRNALEGTSEKVIKISNAKESTPTIMYSFQINLDGKNATKKLVYQRVTDLKNVDTVNRIKSYSSIGVRIVLSKDSLPTSRNNC